MITLKEHLFKSHTKNVYGIYLYNFLMQAVNEFNKLYNENIEITKKTVERVKKQDYYVYEFYIYDNKNEFYETVLDKYKDIKDTNSKYKYADNEMMCIVCSDNDKEDYLMFFNHNDKCLIIIGNTIYDELL